jgi:TonB family protein
MMDYPPKMLAKGMPGVVNVRLAIDERGNVAGCSIQMPLADPAFEKSTCADLQHALEFEPALDQNGKPVASYWVTLVDFRVD